MGYAKREPFRHFWKWALLSARHRRRASFGCSHIRGIWGNLIRVRAKVRAKAKVRVRVKAKVRVRVRVRVRVGARVRVSEMEWEHALWA